MARSAHGSPAWLNDSSGQQPGPFATLVPAPIIANEVSIFLPAAFEQAGKITLITLSQSQTCHFTKS